MDQQVTLVYNGQEELTVKRQALVESCFYFEHLLAGPFKESRQSRVEIFLDQDFPFSVFKAVVEFANSNTFDRNHDISHYLSMRQLVSLWMYDDLADVVDFHLINCISLETLVRIHTRANIFNWTRLKEECIKAERLFDMAAGSVQRHWGRCPRPGHEKHHYINCKVRGRPLLKRKEGISDDDADVLTDADKDEMAEIREIRGMFSLRRHFYRHRRT